MSKSVISLLIIFLYVLSCKAQQVPLLNQYYINKAVYNPSAIGRDASMNAYMIHNSKFSSFEGGHVLNVLNFDMNSDSQNYAVGINLMNEDIGVFNNTQISFSYAYKLIIREDNIIRLGLSFGLADYRLNMSQLEGDLNDPFFVRKNFKKNEFIGNLGLYYKHKDLNIGFMMPQLMNNIIDFRYKKSINSYQMKRAYMLFTEYAFDVNPEKELSLHPSIMMRITPKAPFQFDINALLKYKDLAWFALSYRSNYALSFNLGYKLFNKLKVGYSHDIPIGKVASVGAMANEILVGYSINSILKTKKHIFNKEKEILKEQNGITNTLIIDSDVKEEFKPHARSGKSKLKEDFKRRIMAKDKPMFKTKIKEEIKTERNFNELYYVDPGVEEIYFEEKGATILSLSKKGVDLLVKEMNSNNHYILKMHAFTDSYDQDIYNMKLIMKRFDFLQNQLTKSGVEIQRIIKVPYLTKEEITIRVNKKINLDNSVVYIELFTY